MTDPFSQPVTDTVGGTVPIDTNDAPATGGSPTPDAIRAQRDEDIDAVVALALRAWEPVHESMALVLGPRINRIVHPDWAAGQARATALPLVRYYKELPGSAQR